MKRPHSFADSFSPVDGPRNLTKLGFNHGCFAVDDLEAEVARLKAKGVQLRNEVMEFHNRKLVFLSGSEGVTVELAEWERGRSWAAHHRAPSPSVRSPAFGSTGRWTAASIGSW